MKACSKPACGRSGAAVLSYDYAERTARLLDAIAGELSPHVYVLCDPCAERLRPPRGWDLRDERSASELSPPASPAVLDLLQN